MSLEAHLLAASPHMEDSNFARSVVLLIQHGEEGAFGVVLNRPSEHNLRNVWNQVGEGECALDQPLRLGGPVEGPLLALHDDETLSEREVLPGVHFASQREAITRLVQAPTGPVLLFSGYSGWGGGQLENEVRVGSWLSLPAKSDYVFYSGDDLWKDVISDIGDDVIRGGGRIKHVPPAPWMN